MLAILTSKLGLIGMAVAAVLAVIVIQSLRLAHAKTELSDLQAADAKAVAAAKALDAQSAAISQDQAHQFGDATEKVRTITKTLLKQVKVYVPASADARCVVPVGFVQLYNAAAAGVPAPAGGPDQAPSGDDLSAVAASVVSNFGAAHDWRAEALTWRSWYAAQAAAWAKP